jgi:enediyne biosynthesis protein E4
LKNSFWLIIFGNTIICIRIFVNLRILESPRQDFKKYLLIFLTFLPFAGFSQNNSVVYTDVTRNSGIHFKYTFGDRTYKNILESSGSGISVFDYDTDGDMDVYLLNGTYIPGISDPEGIVNQDTPDQLYRNNGDGTFTEVTRLAGLNDMHWSMAAAVFDYDGDGDLDIYQLNYGPNVFYRNNGNGTYTDITDKLGLNGPVKLNGFTKWSVGAVFWDYNEDGLTDIMVGNFLAFDPAYLSPNNPDIMPHPSEYNGQASMLYKQEKNGVFKDVTKEMGFYYPDSKCMGLTLFDYDDDGDLDLFQGNDHQMNFMFKNEGKGKFREVGIEIGVAGNSKGKPTGSMHGSIGDVDGDGKIDLLVTDLEYGAMYRNTGNGFFEDITERSGLARVFSWKGQWGAELIDYDNDMDLDLFAANGNGEELILQLPVFMTNDGRGNFRDVGSSISDYFNIKRSGRAVASWDYDNDGDMDLIISHIDLAGDAVLLRNDGGNLNHWLGLTLEGNAGPTSAIGAKVTILADGSQQVFVNQWATSYLSYNDPRMHIGMGLYNHLHEIEITWPDRKKEKYSNIQANQYVKILEGKGIVK